MLPVHLLMLFLLLEVGDDRHGRVSDQGKTRRIFFPKLLLLLVHVEKVLAQEERLVSGRVRCHERLDVEQLVGLELWEMEHLD